MLKTILILFPLFTYGTLPTPPVFLSKTPTEKLYKTEYKGGWFGLRFGADVSMREIPVDIQRALPFDLIAINTDSGSEFLNTPVFNQFRERKVIFTRSRPYKKNDNCYVEQKNYTHVRELFGYQRFETKELMPLMNDIYINYWNPLQNYFLPSFKLKDKIRIGGRIKKVYGPPETPYQRLMESSHLSEEQKATLAERRRGLNPFELKRGLEKKLSDFFKLLNGYNGKERGS